jgi:hypothetical protein
MFVHADGVEPELFGIFELTQVLMVEGVASLRIE